MSKTTELRKILNGLFETLITEVHYDTVDDDAPYPHLQYEVREILYNDGKTVIDLEINIFDYGTGSRVIEELADDLQDLLHKYHFINDKIQFTCYKSTRNIVEEEDKKIRRRRLTFEIQLHELKGE
jgi:hypothetical protein